jgi:hypothetical protein
MRTNAVRLPFRAVSRRVRSSFALPRGQFRLMRFHAKTLLQRTTECLTGNLVSVSALCWPAASA